jgi:diguanylate cyclase (GGDEF)-like protein
MFDRVAGHWEEWGELLHIPTSLVPTSDQLNSDPTIAGGGSSDQGDGRYALRVLAVDDDPVSLKIVVSLLKRSGHEVITATNGHEALAMYMKHGAQVVITDWMMPEMDGLMLCQQLRRTDEGRKLYILLLTGQTEEARLVEAFRAGVDDYIVKPFKTALFEARIQPAIRVVQLQEDHDRQVREKERLNRQLDIEKRKFKAAAMTDSLTELPNRRYAIRRLEKEWANSVRTGSNYSVIMIDIDHFKEVNDRWGHDVGDLVLRSTARTIQRVLRRGDTCARMGGEEFLVICPNTDTQEGIQIVAERIRKAVESSVIKITAFEGSITVSLGTALRSDQVKSIDSLLKVADEAVYEAKRGGRNRTVQGTPPSSDRKSA